LPFVLIAIFSSTVLAGNIDPSGIKSGIFICETKIAADSSRIPADKIPVVEKGMCDRFTDEVINEAPFGFIEREFLEEILKEKGLDIIVNSTNARKVGKIVGADAVIIAKITLTINEAGKGGGGAHWRLVDTATARILCSKYYDSNYDDDFVKNFFFNCFKY
jgi:curli biogenesis system outer membrane secretion channel CsgG